MDEKSYWVGFTNCPNIGPGRFGKLLSHFGSAKNVWEAHETDLIEVIGEKIAAQLVAFKKTFLFEYL